MRAVKQKVWNEAEARAVRARKTLTPRFTDFFTGFEEKPTVLQSKQLHFHLLFKTDFSVLLFNLPLLLRPFLT